MSSSQTSQTGSGCSSLFLQLLADSSKIFLSFLFSWLKKPKSLSLTSCVLCQKWASIGLWFQFLSCTGEPRSGPNTLSASLEQNRGKNQLSQPVGCTLPHTALEAVGFCCKVVLLACAEPVHNTFRSFFCLTTLQSVGPQPVLLHGIMASQVQGFVFTFLKIHDVLFSPQPIKSTLNSSPGLQFADSSTKFSFDSKSAAS